MLANGREIHYYTGIALVNTDTDTEQVAMETYCIQLRELTEAQITRYLNADEPWDCASGLKTEGLGTVLCQRLSGADPTALLGLPLIRLVAMLEREGVVLPP